VGATLFPQLSTESTGKFEAPCALPLPPYVLSFTRYAHGEMKFSIYPPPPPAGVALVSQPQELQGLERGPWSEEYRQQTKYVENMRVRKRSLVSCEKFQDDIREIPGYGSLPRRKIFRPQARRTIRECGEIAWRKFRQSGIFATGTVPGSGALIAYIVSCYSGWLLNRVKQWYRDKFTQEYSVFAVWELQERGMLHLHLCVCSLETEKLAELAAEWKDRWNRLLLELSDKTGIDLFRKNDKWSWRDDLQATKQEAEALKKNPARYLSKYLSKGSRDECSASAFHPSRWWSVDRKTAQEARAERVRVVLGGVSLEALKGFVERFFASFGDELSRFIPTINVFSNPQWGGCGGCCCFAQAEESLEIARFFAAVSDDLASRN
jgi:hypothetical protein